jgi:X-Pro dipeptidyl-peptidase
VRLRTALALVALVAASAPATTNAQVNTCSDASRSKVSARAKYTYGALNRVVELPSRVDGAAIQIGLIRPEVRKGARVPVVVQASPYLPALQTVDLETCERFLVENFVPQGYAVALVGVRGTADSGGCFDLFGPKERADLDQAVRWLGTQPWSNGRVGMLGLSYDGSTPWMVAAAGNPYLKTIVPMDGVPDLFDLLFGSGTPDWRGPGLLSGLYYATSVINVPGRAPQRTVDATACPEYAVGQAASAYSALTGEPDPWGYWQARRYVGDILRRYRGSVLLVQGLQDWNVNPGSQFPLISDLAARGRPVKMILGQWGHTYADLPDPPARRSDFADVLLGWFDRYLKGMTSSVGAAVDVQDSPGRWRHETAWPPNGTRDRFWLTPSAELSRTPSRESGTVTVAPDPLHLQNPAAAQGAGVDAPLPESLSAVCMQPVCASFRTPVFSSTHQYSGIPRVRMTVVPQGPGGTLSVALFADGPGGARRIGWGQVDLRFPHGRGRPANVTPGRPLNLDFVLQPLDAVVEADDRLVMIASMGNTYNRLPMPGLPISLRVGGRSAGIELVGVTPRQSQYFTPRKPAIDPG